ncbi:VOC family protein [Nocardia blacklockiae]|uniref:VOC family protein n=1 Tax=Nocardia blacklockiae TaxID=480036 RepID=UPI00189334A1|nr:VOC family protein [Nocardia blacklockiae]MBF6176341.1 VOC family protein [Nocardia blacklockiae]
MPSGFAQGAPCWFDVSAPDVAAAAEFYTGLFGWTALDTGPESRHYTVLLQDDARVAGIAAADADAPGWLPYFAVTDVRATVAAALGAGGSARCEFADIPGQLEFAVLADPDGAAYGVSHLTGHPGTERWSQPNNPCWVQYTAVGAPADAMAHYATTLGWTYRNAAWEQSTDKPYQALTTGAGGGEFGGAAAARPGEPAPFWAMTIHVPDCDATVARAVELGGKVVSEPADMPGPTRIAVLADPAGATFALMAMGHR